METSELKLDSMFRVQTLLLLREGSKSGYDLAKELEQVTGKKPSSGKLYPFLHALRDQEYIKEITTDDQGSRGKQTYLLTPKGELLIDELLERMGNLLEARIDQLLDTCFHCGVRLYESKVTHYVEGEDEPLLFCCKHCMGAFLSEDN